MTSIPAVLPVRTYENASSSDYTMVPAFGRVSWQPILMGAVTAIGIQFVFTVLGIAIGASAGDTTSGFDGSTVRTVGITAGVWWLVTGTLSLAVGGYVLGRLSGLSRSLPLQLEAVAMWGFVALFGFIVVMSGAGMLSQAASPIGAMSAPGLDPYARSSSTDAAKGTALTTSAMSGIENLSIGRSEDARRATRTASWWAVIGMLAGAGAAVGGACAGAPDNLRNKVATR